MAISMVAAYSSGETAFDAVSTATFSSARPLGSLNCTTAVPKSASGWGSATQSVGALSENRPWGSRQATSPWAGIVWAVAPDVGVAEVVPGAEVVAAVGFAAASAAVGVAGPPWAGTDGTTTTRVATTLPRCAGVGSTTGVR